MLSKRELFYAHVAQTSPEPMALEIERGEGTILFDSFGKQYIDLIAGISVSNVGHSHPVVVDAIKEQVESHMHLMVYGEYIQSPQVKLAAKLAQLLPDQLNSTFFVNSGSEANEGAMKLAKRTTGRSKILSFENAYHGSTQGALSVIGDDRYKKGFEPLLPDTFRGRFNDEKVLEFLDEDFAAVIVEPIQGEAGIRLPKNNFLKKLRARCDELGIMLIFDEVQTGFGRTGKFWAFEHYEVVPDILTIAKGMGAGMPIGAFVSSKEIMKNLTFEPVLGHITTFGGHPVSCAASMAGIEVIERSSLLDTVGIKGQEFMSLLKHDLIKEVRGIGLFLCIEFEDQAFNFEVIKRCVKMGVITDWFLFNDKCLRIAPPLNIKEEEIRTSCKIILDVLDEMQVNRNQ